MQAGVPGFQVSRAEGVKTSPMPEVPHARARLRLKHSRPFHPLRPQIERVWDHRAGGETPSGIKLRVAAEAERDLFFYGDRTHPNDRGHQMLAEMLAHLVLRAAEEMRRGPPQGPPVWARRSAEQERGLGQLPPPMIPGNVAVPTSLCAIQVGGWAGGWVQQWRWASRQRSSAAHAAAASQVPACLPSQPARRRAGCLSLQESFKPMVVHSSGFEWRPERPDEPTFVEQKWGWTGHKPGGRDAARACAGPSTVQRGT